MSYKPLFTQVSKICLNCEKLYMVFKNRETKTKYCSKVCQGQHKHKRLGVKRNCQFCGKEFWSTISGVNKGRGVYCSLQCQNQSPKFKIKLRDSMRKGEMRNCKVCGKEFYISRSHSRRGNGVYCSHKCHNHCPEYKEQSRKRFLNNKHKMRYLPNKLERQLAGIIKSMDLPYKFVGDGEVWISGLNPDFINTNSQKKIIELFGEQWHGRAKNDWIKPRYISTENGRRKTLSEYGYDMLVIWTKELRNTNKVKNKLLEFNNSPHIGKII